MEGCCKWIICGLVSAGALGLLTILIFFMTSSGAGGIAEEISGNGNKVTNSESKEISLFHWTNLSDRMADHEKTQGYHNGIKYILIAMVFTCISVVTLYKCFTRKASNVRRRRVTQNLDLVELHHDSLATHGILKNQMTHWRRQEIEKAREDKEEEKRQDKKQDQKKDKKQGKENALKQKPGAGDEEAVAEDGGLKQKPGRKDKGLRWIQVAAGSSEEEL